MAEKQKQPTAQEKRQLIRKLRKRRPWFRRPLEFAYAMKEGWRKPRGMHSKMRHAEKSKPAVVSPGYGSPRIIRGLHPSGYEEVYVQTLSDLQKVRPEMQAARIASGIGKKKRKAFVENAKKLGVKVLNA